jgi:hypothetical protein
LTLPVFKSPPIYGEGEEKCAALPNNTFYPDFAPMSFSNCPYNKKAWARIIPFFPKATPSIFFKDILDFIC